MAGCTRRRSRCCVGRWPPATSSSSIPARSATCSSPSLRSGGCARDIRTDGSCRSEEHTSELQSHHDLVCRLLLEKKKKKKKKNKQTMQRINALDYEKIIETDSKR